MMKESIGFDLEQHAAGSITPAGEGYRTSMIVVRRRCSGDSECAKTVIAVQQCGRTVEHLAIDRAIDWQLVRPTKWRARIVVGADVITIATRDRAVARVEIWAHLEGCGDAPRAGRRTDRPAAGEASSSLLCR